MNGKMYGNHYLGIYEQGFVRLKSLNNEVKYERFTFSLNYV